MSCFAAVTVEEHPDSSKRNFKINTQDITRSLNISSTNCSPACKCFSISKVSMYITSLIGSKMTVWMSSASCNCIARWKPSSQSLEDKKWSTITHSPLISCQEDKEPSVIRCWMPLMCGDGVIASCSVMTTESTSTPPLTAFAFVKAVPSSTKGLPKEEEPNAMQNLRHSSRVHSDSFGSFRNHSAMTRMAALLFFKVTQATFIAVDIVPKQNPRCKPANFLHLGPILSKGSNMKQVMVQRRQKRKTKTASVSGGSWQIWISSFGARDWSDLALAAPSLFCRLIVLKSWAGKQLLHWIAKLEIKMQHVYTNSYWQLACCLIQAARRFAPCISKRHLKPRTACCGTTMFPRACRRSCSSFDCSYCSHCSMLGGRLNAFHSDGRICCSGLRFKSCKFNKVIWKQLLTGDTMGKIVKTQIILKPVSQRKHSTCAPLSCHKRIPSACARKNTLPLSASAPMPGMIM